ncbi:hypothetical protein J2X06_001100 [Lysobacter niastensis]|uniref:Uncharacterized protein n=1 Tax=Lysobacter niastensis TaxID=380629 RepID=A0ABU1W8J2_9GAMM|nr:hypothetical protein [Lysobacter niastensis]MDR7133916.1 hypothetical protein [Lysobacter niastensis]
MTYLLVGHVAKNDLLCDAHMRVGDMDTIGAQVLKAFADIYAWHGLTFPHFNGFEMSPWGKLLRKIDTGLILAKAKDTAGSTKQMYEHAEHLLFFKVSGRGSERPNA